MLRRPVVLPVEGSGRSTTHFGIAAASSSSSRSRSASSSGLGHVRQRRSRPSQSTGPSIAFAYGSIRSLSGLKRWPVAGSYGAVDAVAVPLPGPDAGDVAVPVERLALGQLHPRLAIVGVEEAELDPRRVLREEREIRPVTVPVRAEREGMAGPDVHQRSNLYLLRPKSATRSVVPRRRCSRFPASSASTTSSSCGSFAAARAARGRAGPARAARASTAGTSRAPAGPGRPRRRRPRTPRTRAAAPCASPRRSPGRCGP